jgi:hypothetical protein
MNMNIHGEIFFNFIDVYIHVYVYKHIICILMYMNECICI